ncbi:MAG: HAMP domain-containing sensor histidine kinase [Thermodesulfovibrionales bacterium]|nr:HAMP domain-containing sensor histidine kinase [Thermodesulfovibrionales bacterium]
MAAQALAVLNFIRLSIMAGIMVFIWLLLAMTYFERFIPPFDRFIPWLMPWKGLYAIPFLADLSERMSLMQGLLDASSRVADAAFMAIIISFALFSGYMTYVYQQRQRRSHENRMLMIKNQEILRRNEFIRYISATIGHEFKNNLGRIKRRINLSAELPAEVKERIDGNFEKLFADIDIFKKIADEREAGLVDFTKVNLKKMLEEMAAQYSDLADISFQNSAAPSTIFASQSLLKTVFENLIDNAINYKKPSMDRARVILACSSDMDGIRRYVSLSFKDEGIGMDEQQADRCFYKGKGSGGGWGEGLYFVKYIIGLHAGKIRIGKEYTAPGVGTEIIIHLPFVEEAINV